MICAVNLPKLLIKLVQKLRLTFRKGAQIQKKRPFPAVIGTAAVAVLIQNPRRLLLLPVLQPGIGTPERIHIGIFILLPPCTQKLGRLLRPFAEHQLPRQKLLIAAQKL